MRVDAICLTTLLAAFVACGSGATAPVLDRGPAEFRATIGTPKLMQTVRLEHTVFVQGSPLHVTSVVRNVGADTAFVTVRVCGLNVDGVASGSMLACAAYSMRTTIAPGDSVVGSDPRTLESAPGRYLMRVQQLIDPSLSIEIPIDVVAK